MFFTCSTFRDMQFTFSAVSRFESDFTRLLRQVRHKIDISGIMPQNWNARKLLQFATLSLMIAACLFVQDNIRMS